MDGLIMAAQLILGLSIIVTLHEFGHFIAARAFGIRVEKFYLFFDAWNFKLLKFKKGDTEYGIGWLPLGGYVKISGMIDESMDKEALKEEPKEYEFRSKPAWQRLIVMLGGVIMNFILGIIIFTFITLHFEKEYTPIDAVTDGIYAYDLGQQLGFKTGDKIIAINNEPVVRFKDVVTPYNLMGSTYTIERDGVQHNIVIPNDFYQNFKEQKKVLFIEADNFEFKIDSFPDKSNAKKAGLMTGDKIYKADETPINVYGDLKRFLNKKANSEIVLSVVRGSDSLQFKTKVDSNGAIGFVNKSIPYQFSGYSVSEGFKYGWKDGIGILGANIKGLGKLFTGKEKASESLQGPIGIAKIYGSEINWHWFWRITGIISFILAFMNLLPIPALDGGHVLFLTFEAVTRKKLSDKFMERAQIVGMVILISLMVFAVGNDIWKLFK